MRTVAMFRIGIAVLAGVVLFGVVTLAFGQEDVPVKVSAVVKVTPNKAGTPSHPQGVKLDVRAKIDIPYDYDPPVVQSIDVWFPKGGLYNGGKWPICSESSLARSGVSNCPKNSIMGHATAVAGADGVKTYPKATIVNGGADQINIYVMLSTPARVRQTIVMKLAKLNSPRWSYRGHMEIPRNVQIVAGIPLRLESFHAVVGRGDWLATISCPEDRRWRYHAEATYESGQIKTHDGSIPCRS